MYEDDFQKSQTWEEITEQLKERITQVYPAWTDFNVHDPGMALLELIAWMKDIQLFHMEQISSEHKKKYGKLLGLKQLPLTASWTYVTVSGVEQVLLPSKTKFFAGDICFESEKTRAVADNVFAGFSMYEKNHKRQVRGEWLKSGKGVSIHPFGRSPEVGNVFEIELRYPLKQQWPYSLTIETETASFETCVDEEAYDGYGFYALGEVRIEYMTKQGWKKASVQEDSTYGFTQNGSMEFMLYEEMDERFHGLRFTLLRSDYLIPPCLVMLSLSQVRVQQQETLQEALTFRANGFPNQRYDIQGNLLLKELLSVDVDGESWNSIEDFDCSEPESRHFKLENGCLSFGNGVRGRAPRGMISIKNRIETYGSGGNVKAHSIDRICFDMDKTPITVTNERESKGGRDLETKEEMFERFDFGEKNLHRAATLQDYEYLVKRIPGLAIDDCKAYEENPGSNQVVLAVKPKTSDGYGELNEAYIRNIYTYLEEKRLLGTRLLVVSPEYIPVRITCEITANVKYRDAKARVEECVETWVKERTFGQGIVYGELYGTIDTLSCVSFVHSLWIEAGSRGKRNTRGDLQLPKRGFLKLLEVTCLLLTDKDENS